MNLGSLFSGGGLGDFGFMAAGIEISWQVEIDDYCQQILALRYPETKKYRDIKSLKGNDLEKVNIITGGFPCQPFSIAGSKKGTNDDRHLWPEMFRIIQEKRPDWVVGENVSGFVGLGLDHVLADLESAQYETTTLIFPAHALGARHRRERVWIIANSQSNRTQGGIQQQESNAIIGSNGNAQSLADTSNSGIKGMYKRKNSAFKNVSHPTGEGQQEQRRSVGTEKKISGPKFDSEIFRKYWKSEPAVGRVAHGIANRVHRLRMLGNGQVPACTYLIGAMIKEIDSSI